MASSFGVRWGVLGSHTHGVDKVGLGTGIIVIIAYHAHIYCIVHVEREAEGDSFIYYS
jgi:hypothetical protein